MRFMMEAKELAAAVVSVSKALAVRSTMPILEGVYIEAEGNQVKFECSDLMLQKECTLPAAVEEEGKVIVPAKLFMEIVRKLPDATAEISLNAKSMEIRCGRAKSSIACIEYEEFPQMRFTGDTYVVKIDHAVCRDMISGTVFAVAQDDSKPILTGALLEIGENLTMVATDAYQFAMRTEPLKNPVSPSRVVIPGKSIAEIAHMMDETDGDVELTFTKTHVKVDINHTCLVARLLDGDYINYKNILPKEQKTRVLIDRAELIESIDRAQLMAREGNSNIVMHFHSGKLNITANSFVGNIDESMDAQITGEDVDIAFNPRFCLNVLKCIPGEKIYMDFVTNISPAVIRPAQQEGYYYLIVPVRIFSQF